jgi:23S rRNA pseudouridine2605 synthase
MERLNKLLARCGVASRRGADRMIEEGRVTVNGSVVRELGTRVQPQVDTVKVDGRRLPTPPRTHLYLMLNKPRGVLTTLHDPERRPTVGDLLRRVSRRVFPVGRLDFQTEGLLLLTDDGALARELMHPGRGVPKTYRAKVRGAPPPEALARLRRGLRVDGRMTQPARVTVVRPGANCWLELTIVEGRKHQVRRMLDTVGHPVVKLRRVGFGPLVLGDLPTGRMRPLSPAEVARLRRAGAPREGGAFSGSDGSTERRN